MSDGRTESREMVFCEAELRSVPVSRCDACPFVGPAAIEIACCRTVDCNRSILPIAGDVPPSRFSPAVAAVLPVGLALGRVVVCAHEDLRLAEAARTPLLAENARDLPIVDGAGALVGILPASAIASMGSERPPYPPGLSVVHLAVSAVPVHETDSLGDAFSQMGARRVRELPVIADGGIVVGVLRDVDALRFVAHLARTGARPGPECVA